MSQTMKAKEPLIYLRRMGKTKEILPNLLKFNHI